MEICNKYKIFIKNGRFWNEKKWKREKFSIILMKNEFLEKVEKKYKNTYEYRNDWCQEEKNVVKLNGLCSDRKERR